MWSFKSFSDFLLQGETQPAVLQTCFLESFPHFFEVFIGKLSSCAAGWLPSSSLHSQLQNRILLKRSCHWQPRNCFCLENSTFGFLKNQPFCPSFPGQWSTIPAFSCISVLLDFGCQPSSFQYHIKNSWSPSSASWSWVSLFQVIPELEFYCEGEKPPQFSPCSSLLWYISLWDRHGLVATSMSKGIINMPALRKKIVKNLSFLVSHMNSSLYSNRKYKVKSVKAFNFSTSTLPFQGQKNLSALGGLMVCLWSHQELKRSGTAVWAAPIWTRHDLPHPQRSFRSGGGRGTWGRINPKAISQRTFEY